MGVTLTDDRCSESRDRDIETDAKGMFIPIRSTKTCQGRLRLLTRERH